MPNLYSQQQAIVDDYPNKLGLYCEPGTGKSAMAISIAKKYGDPFVAICPKSLPENWHNEINKWWPEASKIGYTVISKEQFGKRSAEIKARTIIVDESHLAYHNYKTKLFKTLYAYLKANNIQHLIPLTGTPMTATYWSIWSAAKLMGKDWNYIAFRARYFKEVRMGMRKIWLPKKDDKTKAELATLINKLGYTLSLSDISEVPLQNYIYEYFDLTPAQRKAYISCSDPNPAVFHTRKHQVESGSVQSDGYREDVIIEDNKTPRIVELCAEHTKIIIVARFNLQLENYKQVLSAKFPDRPVDIINGTVSSKDREQITQAHNLAPANILLVNAEVAEGYNLQQIPTMVFASMSFAYLKYKQMHARVQRADNLKVNTYIYLITRKHPILGESTDARVAEAMSEGRDFNEMIYEKS